MVDHVISLEDQAKAAPAPAPTNTREKEKSSTTTRGRAKKGPKVTEAVAVALRIKASEIVNNTLLMQMAEHDPEAYVEEVKTLTRGWSPDEIADITGDDSLRPHHEEGAHAAV